MLSAIKTGFVVSAGGTIQEYGAAGRLRSFQNQSLQLPRRAKVSFQVELAIVPGFEQYGYIDQLDPLNIQWDGVSMEPIETAPFIYNSEVPA